MLLSKLLEKRLLLSQLVQLPALAGQGRLDRPDPRGRSLSLQGRHQPVVLGRQVPVPIHLGLHGCYAAVGDGNRGFQVVDLFHVLHHDGGDLQISNEPCLTEESHQARVMIN
jgi:hypothetical protein